METTYILICAVYEISDFFLHGITMLFSLTVGKVDAGVAVLLTEDKRLVCAIHSRLSY